jgi:hypothetical protein
MVNNFTRLMILSAELKDNTIAMNMRATDNLERFLDEIKASYIKCKGVYKGEAEISFLVKIPSNEIEFGLSDIAFKEFDQESVLIQDSQGKCFLKYANGSTEDIGKLTSITEKEAEKIDAYTKLPSGKYLATVRMR